jgi:hypothetical protein
MKRNKKKRTADLKALVVIAGPGLTPIFCTANSDFFRFN